MGCEHFSVFNGNLHLDFLPYSHSIFSGIICSLIAFAIINWGFKNRKLALAFSVGILSHIIIDLLFHEKDIRLSPFSATPVWGLGVINYPWLNFSLELIYGIICWWYFKGNKGLLTVIVLFNLSDLPIMLAHGEILEPFEQYPSILPSVILFQIVITWYFIWRFSKTKKIAAKQNTETLKTTEELISNNGSTTTPIFTDIGLSDNISPHKN